MKELKDQLIDAVLSMDTHEESLEILDLDYCSMIEVAIETVITAMNTEDLLKLNSKLIG